jgi:hypothetical protein
MATDWYSNRLGRKYHLPSPRWISSGLAACGRLLRAPGIYWQPTAHTSRTLCRDCVRLIGSGAIYIDSYGNTREESKP